MVEIRNAKKSDLSEIVRIQNDYILNGFNGMFYEQPFQEAERVSWFQQFTETGPHQILVAITGNKIAGVATSFAYRGGGVFSQTVETSIYTAIDQKTKGIGTLLYGALFERLSNQALHRAVVGIALPNEASVALHKKFEFTEIGTFDEYAFFKGKYISSLWMQKNLNP